MQYKQKDLGYKRTKTSARYMVHMDNLTMWSVPVQIIADSRDEYYKDDKEDTIKSIRKGDLDPYGIKDWASGNMNWADVKEYAVQEDSAGEPNWEECWMNSPTEILGNL